MNFSDDDYKTIFEWKTQKEVEEIHHKDSEDSEDCFEDPNTKNDAGIFHKKKHYIQQDLIDFYEK